jgi:hypothetical protein
MGPFAGSLDGRRAAYIDVGYLSPDVDALCVYAGGGIRAIREVPSGSRFNTLTMSPDGRYVAYAISAPLPTPGRLNVWRLWLGATDGTLQVELVPGMDADEPDWAPPSPRPHKRSILSRLKLW